MATQDTTAAAPHAAPSRHDLAAERDERHARQRAEQARALRLDGRKQISELLAVETRAIFAARARLGALGARPEDATPPTRLDRLAVLAGAPAIGVALAAGGQGLVAFAAGTVLALSVIAASDALALQWAMQVRDDSDDRPRAAPAAFLALAAAAGIGCVAHVVTGSPWLGGGAGLVAAALLGLVVFRARKLAAVRHAHRVHPRLRARHEATIAQHELNVRQLETELGPLMTAAIDAAASTLERAPAT